MLLGGIMGLHALRAGRWSVAARLLVACAFVGGSVVGLAGPAQPVRAAAGEVLILGATVTGGASSLEAQEVAAQGFTPVVVDDTTWEGMTTAQFASYRAIVIGDPTCGSYDDTSHVTAALSNPGTWGAAVNGNVLIIGTDPVFHSGGTLTSGPGKLIAHGIDFAVAQSGKTGAYIDLSCAYGEMPANTPVTLLDGLRAGGFTVDGTPSSVCYNDAHIVATHPALTGLADADLSNWGCSVHESFDTWPGDYTVLAMARNFGSTYTSSDGTVGEPYILASGTGLHSFPLSLSPLSDMAAPGGTHTVTAQLLDAATSAPVAGAVVTFGVTQGPNTGATGTCGGVGGACVTGSDGTVTWTYTSNGSTGDDTIRAFLDQNNDGVADVGEPQTTAGMHWQASLPKAGDVVCGRSGPGGLTDDWVYTAQVTASEGLAVKDVRFGPRYVARKISVPYIRPVGFGSGTGHLTVTPDTSDPDLRSTLLRVDCNANGHPGVSATYSVSSLSTNLTFLVQQSYRFDPFNVKERCEATETTNCVRFWPTVTWALPGARVPDPAYGLNVVQRFEFDPDQYDPAQPGHGAADVIADTPAAGNRGVDDLGSGGSLKREDAIKAITDGKTAYWENWHQTDRDSVGLPGISVPGVPAIGVQKLRRGSAGCSECVHAHWSWFAHLPSQLRNNWSDGKPEILDGSKQTDCIGWVKSTTVVPETDWCARAASKNHQGARVDPATDRLVMYWDASTTAGGSPSSGVSINGADFAVGDSYWPQLDQVETQHADGTWPHGGNGSMFIVPARRLLTVARPRADTEASITPLYGAVTRGFSGARLPAGWVLPVRISLGNNSDQGPYFLRVKSTSARLLNPAPLYSPAGGGAPWVLVYNDTLGRDGVTWHLASGPPLARYNGRQGYMLALVVFDQKPTAADTSFELDAAPDGVSSYLPSTGNW